MAGRPVVAVLSASGGGDGERGRKVPAVGVLEVGEVLGAGVVVGHLGDVEVDYYQAARAGGDADALAAMGPGGLDASGVRRGPLLPAGVPVTAPAVGVIAQVGGVVGHGRLLGAGPEGNHVPAPHGVAEGGSEEARAGVVTGAGGVGHAAFKGIMTPSALA